MNVSRQYKITHIADSSFNKNFQNATPSVSDTRGERMSRCFNH